MTVDRDGTRNGASTQGMLLDLPGMVKGKVIPLQARCGPEGG